jgi:two-component system cell cycle response regulator DivK
VVKQVRYGVLAGDTVSSMPEINSKPNILLVEDYDDAREMYRDYLEFAGFQVDTARDGHEALDKARSLMPDLILMDLSLPGLDGWEATRMLKGDPATRHLVIVALSAHALAAEGERARLAGCDGFIAKPCLPHDLVDQMVGYLKVQSDPPPRTRRTRARRS